MTRRQLIALLIVGLAVIAWVAAVDQARPWKRAQLELLAARQASLEAYLEEMRRAGAEEIRLRGEAVRLAHEALESGRRERRDLEQEIFRLERQWRSARLRLGVAADAEQRREARIEAESYAGLVAERRGRLDSMLAEHRRAVAELSAARQPLEAVETELATLRRDAWWRRLPALRYLAPSLEVRQLGLAREGGRARPDRCVTCHLGSVGSELGPELSGGGVAGRPHPRPDLVGPSSQHDPATTGCTPCHGGDGRATDLARAGHLPTDAATAERWRRDWGWRPGAVTEPILAGPLIEAGCASCHGDTVWLAGTPRAERGRRLVARMGCAGCHRLGPADLDSRRPVGPDLGMVAAATTPGWVARYLADPRAARPDSVKPVLWRGAAEAERQTEIAVLVAELWRRSAQPSASGLAGLAGEAATGAGLFDALGCGGCHALVAMDRPGEHASSLAGLGEHRGLRWLVPFLTGDRSVGRVHRPDLRLSSAEAADLAAFLVGEQVPDAEDAALPPIDSVVRDRLLLRRLEGEGTIEAAQATLESLSEAGRSRALGERLLELYGCASCHRIPELSPAVEGGDLTRIGDRLARRLQRAGRVPQGWLHAEAHEQGPRAGSPRLGDSALTAADSQALFVQLLGWRQQPVVASPPSRSPPPSSRPALAAGRAVLERHGCRACHAAGGAGGDGVGGVHGSLDRLAPRLDPGWVVDFLRDPAATQVRPWLEMRMPRFDLEPAELDAVANWFAARAGAPRTAEAAPERNPLAEAVGGAVFGVLQCGGCHGLGPRPLSEGSEGLPPIHLAPDYRLTRERLRPDWVAAFLLDAEGVDPLTAVPPLFPTGDAGHPDASYLVVSLKASMFDVHRQRLRRHFESEDELWAYLSDPDRISLAVRAYLWSLGES